MDPVTTYNQSLELTRQVFAMQREDHAMCLQIAQLKITAAALDSQAAEISAAIATQVK